MRFKPFIKLYLPLIFGYGIIVCFAKEPFGMALYPKFYDWIFFPLILLYFVQVFLCWKRNVGWSIHNLPILLSWFLLINYFVIFTTFFWGKEESIFYTRLIINQIISVPLFFIQLIDWILFYIDWPVSRYIKRNIESMWNYIKKGIESLKAKKNRKRLLNCVGVVCVILVVLGIIKTRGYLDDQKELGRSKIYQLPIKVIGIHPMPKGVYVNYEVKDCVPSASGENPDEFIYVTFKQSSSNIVQFEKAHLKHPETNNYLKVNVNSFLNGLDGKSEVEFYLEAKNYFIDKEKLKKIDPKVLNMQNIPSINYVMIRLYKGYHKVEKIKFGEVEI